LREEPQRVGREGCRQRREVDLESGRDIEGGADLIGLEKTAQKGVRQCVERRRIVTLEIGDDGARLVGLGHRIEVLQDSDQATLPRGIDLVTVRRQRSGASQDGRFDGGGIQRRGRGGLRDGSVLRFGESRHETKPLFHRVTDRERVESPGRRGKTPGRIGKNQGKWGRDARARGARPFPRRYDLALSHRSCPGVGPDEPDATSRRSHLR
jgi:hypothetical protein